MNELNEMNELEKLDDLDHIILNKITESKKGINTYELSKRIDVSWSTTSIRCYRLSALGKITSKLFDGFAVRRRRVWKIKK